MCCINFGNACVLAKQSLQSPFHCVQVQSHTRTIPSSYSTSTETDPFISINWSEENIPTSLCCPLFLGMNLWVYFISSWGPMFLSNGSIWISIMQTLGSIMKYVLFSYDQFNLLILNLGESGHPRAFIIDFAVSEHSVKWICETECCIADSTCLRIFSYLKYGVRT